MISKKDIFLEAWLQVSSTVSNERIVSDMPFNEAQICNILYYQNLIDSEKNLTATDFGRIAHMHKTLVNRTLNSLEKKQIIKRVPDPTDKRRSFIKIDNRNFKAFIKVHEDTMRFVDKVVDYMGEEKMLRATEAFNDLSEAVNNIMYYKEIDND